MIQVLKGISTWFSMLWDMLGTINISYGISLLDLFIVIFLLNLLFRFMKMLLISGINEANNETIVNLRDKFGGMETARKEDRTTYGYKLKEAPKRRDEMFDFFDYRRDNK